MKARTLVILVAALVPLFACSDSFEIAVIDSPNKGLHFVLSKHSQFKPIELNQFMVVPQTSGSWDYKHPLWSFARPPGSYSDVREIVYGIVPPGFTENQKPEKLLPLVSYLAIGFGAGNGGSTEFKVGR